MKPHIVILGAGFGGLAAAKTLAAGSDRCQVTVIDRNSHHVFTPLLYEAATGYIERENIGSAKLMRSGVAVPTAGLLARWNADFVEGEITGVDWEKREVRLKTGVPVRFDKLVIALGAETNFFGIEGMAENAFTLKSAKDADRLRQRIKDCLAKRAERPGQPIEVFIGGAGATGTELAAEATMFMRVHLMRRDLRPDDFQISLIEAQSRVLGMMSPSISAAAEERLRKLGIKLYLDTCIKRMSFGKVILAPRPLKPGETSDGLKCDFRSESEKTFDADIMIWTGGICGCSTLELFGLPLDGRGKRIEVGANFEVPGRADVFAIGDSALLMDPAKKMPAPWLAQAAVAEGEMVARTILGRLAAVADKTEPRDALYDFREYAVVFPLGGKFAIFHYKNLTLIGWTGWVVKELANLRYFLSILPFFQALKIWWHGALMYSKND